MDLKGCVGDHLEVPGEEWEEFVTGEGVREVVVFQGVLNSVESHFLDKKGGFRT